METELEHLDSSGSLSKDYVWKVKNAYRSIKDDAEWCEQRSILTLPFRMIANAAEMEIRPKMLTYGIAWTLIGVVATVVFVIACLVAGPIGMGGARFLFATLGIKESYSPNEMASLEFLFTGVLMVALIGVAYAVGFFVGVLPLWFFGGSRLDKYEKKRRNVINGLIDEGIRDFGGARFERELSAAVSILDCRAGGVSKFLCDLKEHLDSGHIVVQKTGSNDETNFYSKGFKEKVGGMFAVSTAWVLSILFIVLLISAIIFFLWRRFLN